MAPSIIDHDRASSGFVTNGTSCLMSLLSMPSSYPSTSFSTQSASKSYGEIVEGVKSEGTNSSPFRDRLFRSADHHFPSEESTEPPAKRHKPNLPEENLHNLLDGYQVKALNPKIQNALVTIQQQLLSLEKFDEPRSVYQRPEMDEISAESPRPVTPNPPTPPSLPSLSPPSQIAEPQSSTPPSRPSAEVPTEMDYPDVEEEEDPLQISLIDVLPNDQATVLGERECTEETTVEEKGKVYARLGEPAGETEDPAQKGRKEPVPVKYVTCSPRENRKRPFPEESPSKPESAPGPRLSKYGRRIGRPLGSFKLRRPLPEDNREEKDDDEERICRWKACGKQFMQQDEFANHVLGVHMEEDENRLLRKCLWEGCSRRDPFSTYPNIRAHVRSHMQHKPFVCTEPGCNRAYGRMEHLKTHRNVHTGERPFECSICEKKFTNCSDAARHERHVHADDKQYQCGVETCGKSYKDLSSLRKHFRHHHPELFKEFKAGKHRIYIRRDEEEQ